MLSSRSIIPARLPFSVTGTIAEPPGMTIRSREVMDCSAQSRSAATAWTAKARKTVERQRIRRAGFMFLAPALVLAAVYRVISPVSAGGGLSAEPPDPQAGRDRYRHAQGRALVPACSPRRR